LSIYYLVSTFSLKIRLYSAFIGSIVSIVICAAQ